MEAKLLGTKSEAYGPTNMRGKRKECYKVYITFCQQEGKSDVVMWNSNDSKLLHKNEEKLRDIRTTSLNIDKDWYLDTKKTPL